MYLQKYMSRTAVAYATTATHHHHEVVIIYECMYVFKNIRPYLSAAKLLKYILCPVLGQTAV